MQEKIVEVDLSPSDFKTATCSSCRIPEVKMLRSDEENNLTLGLCQNCYESLKHQGPMRIRVKLKP